MAPLRGGVLPVFEQWEVVRIEWIDACGAQDKWEDIEEDDQVPPHRIVTVGQVHSQGDHDVTICLSWDVQARYAGGWITIPAANILGLERFA